MVYVVYIYIYIYKYIYIYTYIYTYMCVCVLYNCFVFEYLPSGIWVAKKHFYRLVEVLSIYIHVAFCMRSDRHMQSYIHDFVCGVGSWCDVTIPALAVDCFPIFKQVSFKKEVVVRVNDLVFWLTVWLNFENVLLTFMWYVFVWQKCSMLTKYANGHFSNKWNCVSMP